MRRGAGRSGWVLAACLAALGPRPSQAQEAPKAAPAAAPRNLAEAQQRYRRGIELVNEGAYESALLEFRRAYELAPSYKILFNIAQVNRALNDYAMALRSFERYLKEGGGEVPPEMAAEVRREIEVLRTRVAKVTVTSSVAGAEVSVDDLVVGKTPLAEPVLVNAGRRKVTVAAAGRLPETRVIEATGADSLTINLEPRLPGPVAPPPPALGAEAREAPSRGALPWALWGGAALLAGGAAVTGALAIGAADDFDDLKAAPLRPGEGDRYDDAHAKMMRLSVATDVLAGLALVTGGAALYFTLKPARAPAESAGAPSVSAGLGPGGLLVRGAF
ncbi:MAG TPA: PEGA domain-containing protein [Polyangiaceae bacterium]|nr:PEGA domain-containing protein [Polyangiaceae bacterium]